MKQPKPPDAKDAKAPDKRKRAAKPEPFDLWLTRGLHQIYDDVANEPIPDELRRLIEEDRLK